MSAKKKCFNKNCNYMISSEFNLFSEKSKFYLGTLRGLEQDTYAVNYNILFKGL